MKFESRSFRLKITSLSEIILFLICLGSTTVVTWDHDHPTSGNTDCGVGTVKEIARSRQ